MFKHYYSAFVNTILLRSQTSHVTTFIPLHPNSCQKVTTKFTLLNLLKPIIPNISNRNMITKSSIAEQVVTPNKPNDENEGTLTSDAIFQCPSCKSPIEPIKPQQIDQFPKECSVCSKQFPKPSGYIDLTPDVKTSLLAPRQTVFQSPLTSFAYERGWRDNFKRAGFPGIETERDLFLDYVMPASTVLDLSCGSGFMARQFAIHSTPFYRVVASDYSNSMLREAVSRAKLDINAPQIDFVRADVSNLPFCDHSFDAIHAGAAIHCWVKLQDGLKEVNRILKKDGKFFATTFLRGAYIPDAIRNPKVDSLKSVGKLIVNVTEFSNPFRFFEIDELEWMLKAAGFVDVQVERIQGCLIAKGRKKM